MRSFTTILLLVAAMLSSRSSSGASIGLFSTPDCSSCNLSIPGPSTTGQLYIAANVDNSPELCNGLLAAYLRVEGLPAGWSAIAAPAPNANVFLGDPFAGGAAISFPIVQMGVCVQLCTVIVAAPSPGAAALLRIAAYVPPIVPWLDCGPIIQGGCFEPDPVCVAGGALFINSSVECTVGVRAETWTGVRLLYRE